MNIKILNNRTEIISSTVNMLIDRIKQKPDLVLGLSTGATTLSICGALSKAVADKKISLKDVVIFYAGEYIGFSQKQFYFQRLQNDFFSKVDLQNQNIHTLSTAIPQT